MIIAALIVALEKLFCQIFFDPQIDGIIQMIPKNQPPDTNYFECSPINVPYKSEEKKLKNKVFKNLIY